MTAFELFQEVLVGDFNNRNQVALEKATGKQVHPFAVHVNRIFTNRIKGLPEDFKGCYILEESYYDYPGETETRIKPHLFLVEPHNQEVAKLTPQTIPSSWTPKDVRNDNLELSFHIDELTSIPWFGTAMYVKSGDRLHVHHTCQLGEGKQFSLIEYFTKDRLDVMELMEQDGKRLTPYATPIIYERIQQSD